ncbi:site-2 protease family protein [Mitsuokella sp. oral taxon 131]|uniref:site-2 protease family protein n=1 Tax=Mitsuokella sp. oral taxon 131 TaxID=1321780 RepID=UPI0003ADBF52|nr:site-2 protease family protein [Mitsuokella sp. oral taxon 131]ERL03250.1 peptidase, M50 family [Mitsuokella sp. oral taxon 131 str. W9106]
MSGYILNLIAGIPGLIIAMVIHEYAHARTADALGDFTPRMMGRITLNPRAHVDPIGLIMLFLVRFGWAKPVMINPNNFKNPRRDDILVSLAGPAANLVLAFLALSLFVLLGRMGEMTSPGVYLVLKLIVVYNINFAIFNMIPLPPLDGSHILRQILPPKYGYRFAALERYSFLILIILVMTPVLSLIFIPLQNLVWGIFLTILSPLM